MCYNLHVAKFNEVMERGRAKKLSPGVLAFVGDAAYSLFVREGLVLSSDYKTGELQKMSSAQVSAKGQASLFSKIEGKITEEEREIFLRGRNAKKPTKSKSASVAEYNISTGFEAVIGFLYLSGDYQRISELLTEQDEN